MKHLSLLSVAGLFAAATVSAQTPPRSPRGDSGCVSGPNGRVECAYWRMLGPGGDSMMLRMHQRMDSMMSKRAVLGLELRPTGSKRDTLGVFVENVVPRGPAESAGIVEGDRIASINGVDLRTSGADLEDPYTNALAAHRLSREVQKLTPGSKVNLRVWSGGRYREVQVTAGKATDFMHNQMGFGMDHDGAMMLRMHGPGGMMMPMGPEGMRMMMPPDRDQRRIEIRPPDGGAAPHPGAVNLRSRSGTINLRAPLARVRVGAPRRPLIRV